MEGGKPSHTRLDIRARTSRASTRVSPKHDLGGDRDRAQGYVLTQSNLPEKRKGRKRRWSQKAISKPEMRMEITNPNSLAPQPSTLPSDVLTKLVREPVAI